MSLARALPRSGRSLSLRRSPVAVVEPWVRRDVLKAAALIAAGSVLWFIGWWQLSGRVTLADQIAPMNLACVGVAVIGLGQGSWFLSGRRIVAARRRALLGAAPRPARAAASSAQGLVAGGEQYYHRLECPMLTGRDTTPTSRAEQTAAGRTPCGVCKP